MWWALVACRSNEEIAAELEAGFAAAEDALAASLVATEVRHHAHLPPSETTTRHATSCGCPCRTRSGGAPEAVTLDYHPEGCVPASGLVVGGIFGLLVLTVDGDAVDAPFDTGGIGGAPARGTLVGRVTGGPTDAVVESRGDLSVGDRALRLDVVAGWDGDAAALDGTVEVDGVEVVLQGIALGPEGLADECPTPDAGTATVRPADGREVVVDFGVPGGGRATATVGRSTSAPTDPCDFTSRLY